MSMFEVWDEKIPLPKKSELKKLNLLNVTIKPFEPEKDEYVFLHGVALTKFKDKMYCAWAHNKFSENSADEEVNFSVSEDNGISWSDFIKGNFAPECGVAVSHGVFLPHNDRLYFFAPQFKGFLGREMLKMGAYTLNEKTGAFEYQGVALDKRFWPMCQPTLMDDGNYIMSGIYVAETPDLPENTAAVAISHGDDILHWDMVKVPHNDEMRVWGECTVIVNGSNCKMYCRGNFGKFMAFCSESFDYGRTWENLAVSNLPMVDSKPYSGILSNGRRYIVCSFAQDITGRDPLTIALTEKGEEKFSTIYKIAEGANLSYPYVTEYDGKLYIAYSSCEGGNRNSAELAIIDIDQFN